MCFPVSEKFAFLSFLLLHVAQTNGHLIKLKPDILGPPLPNRPFVVAWDVPSEKCKDDFGIDLNLKDFDIVYNENKGWQGDSLVIFHSGHLGLYPSFDKEGHAVNGGLPQCADFNAHLNKATNDIISVIPDKNFQGLAVIDWEAWHALFERMEFDTQNIYRNKSIEKVKAEHPNLTYSEQLSLAKFMYDTAAKFLIDSTLALGKLLRPKALWGFYLYPNCYNYDKTGKNVTCSKTTLELNDRIQWLFDHSTALYPSVYLGEWFKNKIAGEEYVKNRINEARRVDSMRPGNVSLPILPYHMISYKKETKFLDLVDLVHSIGVAALLGTSGMVIWGGHNVANTSKECSSLKEYLDTTLGPFCKKVSDAATACSTLNCNGHGRCVVASAMKMSLRYLNTFEAEQLLNHLRGSAYYVFDKRVGKSKFFRGHVVTCQCYSRWTGEHCEHPEAI